MQIRHSQHSGSSGNIQVKLAAFIAIVEGWRVASKALTRHARPTIVKFVVYRNFEFLAHFM
jgi:hypothetical protein